MNGYDNSAAGPIDVGSIRYQLGYSGITSGLSDSVDYNAFYGTNAITRTYTETNRVTWHPTIDATDQAIMMMILVLCIWLLPFAAGLITQIRKGLPEFARVPRTITAAFAYESHRLVYASAAITLFCAADIGLRLLRVPGVVRSWETYIALNSMLRFAAVLFIASGWIGPLWSDFTQQLVRSRKHAARIIIMYAIAAPLAITAAGQTMLYVLRQT